MKRQLSFQEAVPTLYLVATPIGNRQELSPRAIETLQAVSVIFCEDTRHSAPLLAHYGIHKPLISHHEHNQHQSIETVLSYLSKNEDIALISDAGYPLLSDPGSALVRTVIREGFFVCPISGPNAALNALVASGLSTEHFLFYGFLEAKQSARIKQLESLKDFPYTLVFYESVHRIQDSLQDCLSVLGNRQACLARELTKLYEEWLRGSLSELVEASVQLKGEMVIVIEGASKQEVNLEQLIQQVLDSPLKLKEACKQVSQQSPIKANELYQAVLEWRKQHEDPQGSTD